LLVGGFGDGGALSLDGVLDRLHRPARHVETRAGVRATFSLSSVMGTRAISSAY
jgi:hypothetical protein